MNDGRAVTGDDKLGPWGSLQLPAPEPSQKGSDRPHL